jgi:hypothetical protein
MEENPMTLIRGFTALLTMLFLACGGEASEPSSDETSGDERASVVAAPSDAEEEPNEREGEPEETASTNKHALSEDASQAMHQAEWLREEQVRLERALEIHMGRHDIRCPAAKETRDEVCLVTDRICALVSDDAAIASRCEEARENCQKARKAVSAGGCKG